MQIVPRSPGFIPSIPINVTRAFVRLRHVTDGVIGVNLGRKHLDYRGIIKVNCVNFSLLSENEQDAVVEGFKAFLNGLTFPIQIFVRNLPHDLSGYLRAVEATEGNMAETARDHARFVRLLSTRRALVQREYYMIVPIDHQRTNDQTEAIGNALFELDLRLDELIQQLERIGLVGKRLSTAEVLTLYHSCFNLSDAGFRSITQEMIEGRNKPLVEASDRERTAGHLTSHLAESSMAEQEEMIDDLVRSLHKQEVAKHAHKGKQSWTSWLPLGSLLPKKQGKPRSVAEKYPFPKFVQVTDLIAPSSIQVFADCLRIDGEEQTEFTSILALIEYPRGAYPGWLDRMIQIDEPHVDFSMHISPQPAEVVTSQLGRKATYLRGSALVLERQGQTVDPSTTIALEDVEELQESLVRGDERIFNINIFIRVRAKDQRSLVKRRNRIVTKIRSLDFRALPTHWQHHLALLSCLPDARNGAVRICLFGTDAAGTFFPFTGSDISMERGVMFGVQANGGMIIINPFNSKILENANMVVFAKSGAGKSFFLKTVSCRLLSTCNVYVVDPEAEYQNLCEQVKGQYVRLSTDSLQINPFELYATAQMVEVDEEIREEESTFFREKLLNLITLFELLLSDQGVLPQMEKAFLYQCLIKTYENRGITMDPATHGRQPPNMQEFFVIMSSALRGDDRFGVGEDSYGLSQRLERYLHLFPARTRLSLDNRYIDFNIRELNEALKPIGLFLITEFLWVKMRQARRYNIVKSNTIILIDEAWLLMKFQQGAKFLEEFSRRIRKYGGGLWCTTQNSDDFLRSDEGKTILAMATMKFLMKQDSSTIDSVVHTFNLSPRQKAFLLGTRRGEGLFATKTWVQMQVLASPKETDMANTTLISLAQTQQQIAFQEQDLQRMAMLKKDLAGNGKTPPGQSGQQATVDSSATRILDSSATRILDSSATRILDSSATRILGESHAKNGRRQE